MKLTQVESLRSNFIDQMKKKSTRTDIELNSYSKFFEDVGIEIVEDILKSNGYTIIPTPRNQYPEVKFTDGKSLYAIDIKTARACSDPQFDLCYLSLYEEMNYKAYDEEWVLIVKYDSNKTINTSLVDCYFEKLHNVAALQKTRQYAGRVLSKGGHELKIRPLSWQKIHDRNFDITDKEKFLELIKYTQEIVSNDPEKFKKMQSQKRKFINPNRSEVPNLTTESEVIDWIVKNNMNIKTIRKILKEMC
jgi:hypothetical protein